jgi:predicted ATP-binding protein involved in virulence
LQIDSLSVSNFRVFQNSEFNFDPKLNLIIGANGSGKSSLLQAIASALVDVVSRLSRNYLMTSIGAEEVRIEMTSINNQVRFEKRFPAQIDAKGSIFQKDFSWSVRRSSEDGTPDPAYTIVHPIREIVDTIDVSPPFVLPLVAIYGAHRNAGGENPQLDSAVTEKISRLKAYEYWSDALASGLQLQTWVIGKTLERLQLFSEGNLDPTYLDELAVTNKAIAGCIPNAKGIRYDLRLRSLVIEFDDGVQVPFFNLSDGQQSLVALVADIARRVCILNPHLGEKALSETDGIVIIDELDIHLHPAWQRHILKFLRTTFPMFQIFATSHSPQMVGGLPPKQVLILSHGKPAPSPPITYGLDSSQVLEEVMEVDAREPEIRKTIQSMFRSVEDGDLGAAKRQLDNLRKIAPGLPDYAHVEALIRRKEVVGR